MCKYTEAFIHWEEGLGPTKEEVALVSHWKKYAVQWNTIKTLIKERQI